MMFQLSRGLRKHPRRKSRARRFTDMFASSLASVNPHRSRAQPSTRKNLKGKTKKVLSRFRLKRKRNATPKRARTCVFKLEDLLSGKKSHKHRDSSSVTPKKSTKKKATGTLETRKTKAHSCSSRSHVRHHCKCKTVPERCNNLPKQDEADTKIINNNSDNNKSTTFKVPPAPRNHQLLVEQKTLKHRLVTLVNTVHILQESSFRETGCRCIPPSVNKLLSQVSQIKDELSMVEAKLSGQLAL
ncbi:MAG: hypothetical protein MHM6MM_003874 [Cercozoa sp. M6MM]